MLFKGNLHALSINMATVDRSLRGAILAGFDPAGLLRRCGISPAMLDHPNNRVPLPQFIKLCRLTSSLLQDEQYGLLAHAQPIGAYRAMASSAVRSHTLGEALTRYIELHNLFGNSLALRLQKSSGSARVTLSRRANRVVHDEFAIDSNLMIIHRFCGWLINERINLHWVAVDYSPASSAEHHLLFYGAPIIIEQAESAIEFDSAILARPITQHEASLADYMENAPANLYLPLEESGALSLRVRALLDNLPRDQLPDYSFRRGCAALGMSPDRLRRGLHREGTSWQSIRNGVRKDIAMQYLANSKDSVEEIAHKAGYTEAASFVRAFRNWTGTTPLQFRRHLYPPKARNNY